MNSNVLSSKKRWKYSPGREEFVKLCETLGAHGSSKFGKVKKYEATVVFQSGWSSSFKSTSPSLLLFSTTGSKDNSSFRLSAAIVAEFFIFIILHLRTMNNLVGSFSLGCFFNCLVAIVDVGGTFCKDVSVPSAAAAWDSTEPWK